MLEYRGCFMVKISVCVYAFNAENYLLKCLNSICNQTLNEIEIFFIDRGVSGSNLNIIEKFNYKHNDIVHVISSQSVVESLNRFIELAKGDYILFADGDDFFENDAFEKFYENATSNDSDILLFNAIEHNRAKSKKIEYLPISKKKDFSNFVFDNSFDESLFKNNFNLKMKMYKSSFLKDNDVKFYEDGLYDIVLFKIKSLILAKRISYLPEFLYNYNKRKKFKISGNFTAEDGRLNLLNGFDEIENFLKVNGLFEELEPSFLNIKLYESSRLINAIPKLHKENAYQELRNEFLEMELSSDKLKELSLYSYSYYVRVLNYETVNSLKNFEKNIKGNFDFIEKDEILADIKNFTDIGINQSERDERIIVSLTSFPERIWDIHFCIYSLLNQNFKPDKLVLWLANEQFPNQENDLSEDLLNLKKNGLTIKWCEDLKSYKKLIPALKEYPNDFIVTADDDIFYPKDWLENIWETYKENPNTIVASRARQIKLQSKYKITNYNHWRLIKESDASSYLNFPTGAGGTLYFPNALSDMVFDESLFKELCPSADDVWFWAMAILNNTKITCTKKPFIKLNYVNIGREVGVTGHITLWNNNQKGGNNKQIRNVFNYFNPEIFAIIDES